MLGVVIIYNCGKSKKYHVDKTQGTTLTIGTKRAICLTCVRVGLNRYAVLQMSHTVCIIPTDPSLLSNELI